MSITDGAGGPSGPANDNCVDATLIVDGNTPFTTVGSTTDGDNPTGSQCGALGAGFYNDIWFKYTPSADGSLTVSTCNQATFDSRINIYDGCGGLIVACNDDATDCGLTSEVTTPVVCTVTYIIRVGGYGAATFGTGTLSVTMEGGTDCGGGGLPADLDNDGDVDGGDLAILIGGWGGPSGDVDGDGTTTGADMALLLGSWGF